MAWLRSAVQSSDLFALVAILVASLLGFVFPLMSTVFDFGEFDSSRALVKPPVAGTRGRLGLR